MPKLQASTRGQVLTLTQLQVLKFSKAEKVWWSCKDLSSASARLQLASFETKIGRAQQRHLSGHRMVRCHTKLWMAAESLNHPRELNQNCQNSLSWTNFSHALAVLDFHSPMPQVEYRGQQDTPKLLNADLWSTNIIALDKNWIWDSFSLLIFYLCSIKQESDCRTSN